MPRSQTAFCRSLIGFAFGLRAHPFGFIKLASTKTYLREATAPFETRIVQAQGLASLKIIERSLQRLVEQSLMGHAIHATLGWRRSAIKKANAPGPIIARLINLQHSEASLQQRRQAKLADR